jgi:hypothetical protein
MSPKTLSSWIDQLRGMLDDPIVNCEEAVRDVVAAELDALELQLLRERVVSIGQAGSDGNHRPSS